MQTWDENDTFEYKALEGRIPVITLLLIAVNAIVFFYTEWSGGSEDIDHMIDMGAMLYDRFVVKGEYYRIITHFFLHFGFEHLGNNMISLAVLGYALEPEVGKIRFFIIYFFSGILAGIISIVYNIMAGDLYAVSAGASGAIYGLMGALFALMLFRRRRSIGSEIPRFILYVGISIYSGMQDASIDNAAHAGGVLAGFFICGLMCMLERMKERR